MFAEKYLRSLTTSDLRDDEQHRQTEALAAAALADCCARDIGSLLHRVKHSGTIGSKLAKAAAECERLEKLLREALREKGADSKVASIKTALDSCVSGHAGGGGEVNEFRALRRAWRAIVEKKGLERKWIKDADWPQLGHKFPRMVEDIAAASLAYYLDDNCPACNGTGARGAASLLATCKACAGTRKADIADAAQDLRGAYQIELARQMVDELHALEHTHAGVASAKMRYPE